MTPTSERRHSSDRRQRNDGPPAGVTDRRNILERRILNLSHRSFAAWLAEPCASRRKLKLGN